MAERNDLNARAAAVLAAVHMFLSAGAGHGGNPSDDFKRFDASFALAVTTALFHLAPHRLRVGP